MKTSAMGGQLAQINFQQIADDFRSLDPNDPGVWPLVPKIVFLLALLLICCVGGWWFFWDDQLNQLNEKQAEEERLKQEYLDKKKQAVNLDLYTQQLAQIDRSFGALLKQLPQKSEIDALLAEVNQAGLGRGLQFELFKPAPEQIKDFYAELPVVIKLTGNYHDFGAFAADVAKLPRIVTLNNLAINAADKNNPGLLTLEGTLKTFRYLDDAEISKSKKGKGGGK